MRVDGVGGGQAGGTVRLIREIGTRPSGLEVVPNPRDLRTEVRLNGKVLFLLEDLHTLTAEEVVVDWTDLDRLTLPAATTTAPPRSEPPAAAPRSGPGSSR